MTFRNLLAALALAAPLAVLGQAYPPTPVYPPPSAAPPPQGQPAPVAYAQPTYNRLELTGIAGWQINSDVVGGAAKLVVDDAPVYGVAVGVMARPGSRLELTWLYSEPSAKANTIGSESFKFQSHFFQIGGMQSVRRGKLEPFGGATVGAALYMADRINISGISYTPSDTWRFAFTLGLGLKIHLNPRLLARLEIKLAAPVYFSGGGFYAGTGGGGVTVSGGVPLWQWNFLAGLAFGK